MIFIFKQPGLALIRRNQKYIVVRSIPEYNDPVPRARQGIGSKAPDKTVWDSGPSARRSDS